MTTPRVCAAPECGTLLERDHEGPEPYCKPCRRQVWAAHIGPDGPYFVADEYEAWPDELDGGGPQCPGCGGPYAYPDTGEIVRIPDDVHDGRTDHEPAPYEIDRERRQVRCPSCDATYDVTRTATARTVF